MQCEVFLRQGHKILSWLNQMCSTYQFILKASILICIHKVPVRSDQSGKYVWERLYS